MREEEFWDKVFKSVWKDMEQYVECRECFYKDECFSMKREIECSDFLHEKYEKHMSVV